MTQVPRRIGKFEILEPLGAGAMGEVFLARDAILGREVALKTIPSAALSAPEARERFFREAQAAGRLNHPNLVTVHEFGEEQGLLFLAMDFVPGDDLAQLIAARELAPRQILELLAQVCDGLAYAHQRGILHRNIKPSNIRVTRFAGRLVPKVLDFGIARLAGNDPASTGALPGTFGYLAPECIQSGKPDQRSDIFAVGVILYEALTGIRPFGGDSTATVLHNILTEEPPPLDMARLEDISPGIQDILARAIAKAPAGRYPTAEALAADLRSARDPWWAPGAAKAVPTRDIRSFELPNRAPKPSAAMPKSKAWIYLGIPVILAGAAFGGWKWFRHHRRVAQALAAQVVPQPVPQPVQAPPPIVPAVADPPAGAPQEQPKPELQNAPAVAAPTPAKPVPSRLATLNEADAALETDPQSALAFLDTLVKSNPENDRAIALRIVALYNTGDYRASGRALTEARVSGHPIWPLALKYPKLKAMLERERDNPRIPKRKPAPQE